MLTLSLPLTQNTISYSSTTHLPNKRHRFQPPIRTLCFNSGSNNAYKFCSSSDESSNMEGFLNLSHIKNVACGILAVWTITTTSSPALAANVRLPPLSTDPDRCERAYVGNTIGQANGVYDKAIDLRFCDYTNDKTNLKGKSLSAALMSGAKFDGADMSEVVMSKAYAAGASFKGDSTIPLESGPSIKKTIQKSSHNSRIQGVNQNSGSKDRIAHDNMRLPVTGFGAASAFNGLKMPFLSTDFSNAVVDRVNFEKADLQGAKFKNTVLSGSTFDDANLQDVDFEDTIIGYIDLQKICRNTSINEEGRANLGCR
ncbi:hypothetical protein ACFE04_010232 [Oxalis oulophora]